MAALSHLRSPLPSIEYVVAAGATTTTTTAAVPMTPDASWCEQLTPDPEKASQLHPHPPHEGLPRWPGVSSPTHILRSLDLFGTSIFAASGSLAAATTGCDLIGCLVVGSMTAVGGGTWRDVIILHKQPFWVVEWEYLALSMAVAAAVFLLWGCIPLGQTVLGASLKLANGDAGVLLDWGDAVGVGVCAVIGAMNGIRHHCPAFISALCGMITATFGGLTRDVVLNRPVRILYSHAEVYAVIALTGAAVYLSLQRLAPKQQAVRIFACVALVMALRQQAWTHGWRMPVWQGHQTP
ncbi:Aste57867_1357 [Aphanomyces stellatus]|uniref:Aste57867_1357 protein n=1 Tax=Aphanomyces stellatus TaxID=120398 RepID=A0A485K4X7_9STRA|nr:hypothetical protein As57867_001356 [Aphanomyces stellatus]VFT78576.1 Aste57867_1357 [Aphanomyces stellatus]